jgi:hypothetical protein
MSDIHSLTIKVENLKKAILDVSQELNPPKEIKLADVVYAIESMSDDLKDAKNHLGVYGQELEECFLTAIMIIVLMAIIMMYVGYFLLDHMFRKYRRLSIQKILPVGA